MLGRDEKLVFYNGISLFFFRNLQNGSFTCTEYGILHKRRALWSMAMQAFRIMNSQPQREGLAYPPPGDRTGSKTIGKTIQK